MSPDKAVQIAPQWLSAAIRHRPAGPSSSHAPSPKPQDDWKHKKETKIYKHKTECGMRHDANRQARAFKSPRNVCGATQITKAAPCGAMPIAPPVPKDRQTHDPKHKTFYLQKKCIKTICFVLIRQPSMAIRIAPQCLRGDPLRLAGPPRSPGPCLGAHHA